RLVGVDRHDPRMGVRAALDLAPQHARHFHVGAEISPPSNFVDPVGANGSGANDLQRLFIEVTHLPLLSSSFPQKRESRCRVRPAWPWTPAAAGVTFVGRLLGQVPIAPTPRLARGWQGMADSPLA